jgi:hypothetical protein
MYLISIQFLIYFGRSKLVVVVDIYFSRSKLVVVVDVEIDLLHVPLLLPPLVEASVVDPNIFVADLLQDLIRDDGSNPRSTGQDNIL